MAADTEEIVLEPDEPPRDGVWRESRDTPLTDAEMAAGLILGRIIDPDDDGSSGAAAIETWQQKGRL